MLIDYFKSGRYEVALKAYAKFAGKQDWRMSYRAELYAHAQNAFSENVSLVHRRQSFEEVYDGLNRYFRVFRNSTGGHWDADQIFSTLTGSCKPTSRQSGLSLALLQSGRNIDAIDDTLSDLSEVKIIGEYPHMVASKFLHFFNPYLFPIYDREIIWNEVLCGSFKGEWKDWCSKTGISFFETSRAFNVSYTLWGATHIKASSPELMSYFAEWFRNEAQIGDDDLPGLESYCATAFEFIAIGAMVIATGGG